MSLLGTELLHQIVNEQGTRNANIILTKLHLEIRRALHQHETDNREGMDIGLAIWCEKEQLLEFAGAKRDLIYAQNGKMFRLKGDATPLGGEQREKERLFTKHIVPVKEPTTFYLFSDGFQDQFGGAHNRKFMAKPFRELLAKVQELPLQEQADALEQAFEEWKGDERQIDDVLIVGIKI